MSASRCVNQKRVWRSSGEVHRMLAPHEREATFQVPFGRAPPSLTRKAALTQLAADSGIEPSIKIGGGRRRSCRVATIRPKGSPFVTLRYGNVT